MTCNNPSAFSGQPTARPSTRRRRFAAYLRLLRRRGKASGLMHVLTRAGGTRIWEYNNTLRTEGVPEPIVRGRAHDVTARVRAEQALRQSEARFRRLAENAPDIIYRYRLAGPRGFEYVSPAAAAITGYTPEEHYADPDLGFKLVHPDDRPLLQAAARGETGPGNPLVLRWVRKDGAVVWTEQRNVPIHDESGDLIAVEGIARDVTKRKQREQELEAIAATSLALRSAAARAEMPPIILDQTMAALGAQGAAFELLQPDSGELVAELGRGVWQPATGVVIPPGAGLSAQVLASGQPFLDNEADRNPRLFRPELLGECRAVAGVPLFARDRIIGLLWAARTTEMGSQEVRLLAAIADIAANAIENARLLEETQRSLREMEMVSRVSTAMRAAQTLDEMLPLLLDETLQVMGAGAGAIWLGGAGGDELRRVVARGWFASVTTARVQSGEGIAGRVFASGQTHLSHEWAGDPLTLETARAGIPSGWGGACVPIRALDQIIGVIFVSVQLPRELTAAEAGLLNTLAEIAGNAIHHSRLHEQTERRLGRLQALRQIDVAISGSLDLGVTLNALLQNVAAQLGVDAAAVLLLNPHTLMLEYAAGRGFRGRDVTRQRLRLGEGYAGEAALQRRLVAVPDLAAADRPLARPGLAAEEGFQAYFGAPLIVKGQVKGVLEVLQRAPLHPDAEWLDFLETLGGQAAIAVESAQLFDGLQRANVELSVAYDATIEGWARALELRDKETEGHTRRVTELAVRLARALGLSENELSHLRRGAILHDIGKMGIPDRILGKTGPLDADEWAVMRQHAQFAYDMLSPIAYLRPALDIPYCHHEKWDGSGYPRGQRGEQIPLAARIFAVVDVWDAVTSDRPYRPAWPREQALAYIREQAGTHFDPAMAAAFLEMAPEG